MLGDVSVELESPLQLSKGAIVGIALGAVCVAVILVSIISLVFVKRYDRHYNRISRWRSCE